MSQGSGLCFYFYFVAFGYPEETGWRWVLWGCPWEPHRALHLAPWPKMRGCREALVPKNKLWVEIESRNLVPAFPAGPRGMLSGCTCISSTNGTFGEGQSESGRVAKPAAGINPRASFEALALCIGSGCSPAPLSRCNPRTCLVLELSSSLSSHRCPPPAPSHPRRPKPRVPVGSCWPVAELRGATACLKSPAPFPKLQSLSQSISQSLQSPRAPNFSWHAFLAWARTLPISTPGSQEAFFIFFLKFAENIHVFWEPSPFVPGSLGEINGP